MVRRTWYSTQRVPYSEPMRSEDLLEAAARHSGPCIEHHPARVHEHASDLDRHRTDVGFGQVVAHDPCRMHEPNAACIEPAALRIVQRLRDRLIHEMRL